MSFFNLNTLGYQNPIKEVKLPQISHPSAQKPPMNSNLTYQVLKTKHVRSKEGMCSNALFYLRDNFILY
jgi:hypothetical protein